MAVWLRDIREVILNVTAIISDKGDVVHTIAPEALLQDAARALDEKRIGALVVVDEAGAVQGVLSERDVTREVARGGSAALNGPVGAVMSRDVITADPNDSIDELMGRMTTRRIRHLPVMVDGKLAGLVSIGDVVKWKIRIAETEAQAMKDYITTG